MRRMTPWVTGGVALASAALWWVASCASARVEPLPAPSDAAYDAEVSLPHVDAAPRDAGRKDAGRDPTELGGPCAAGPEWVHWDGYDPTCGICVRAADAPPVEPVTWEACSGWNDRPAGVQCEQLKLTWEPDSDGHHLGGAYVAASPNGTLMMQRRTPYGSVWVAASADGPVQAAVLEGAACSVAARSVGDDAIFLTVEPWGSQPGDVVAGYFYLKYGQPVPLAAGGPFLEGQDGITFRDGFARLRDEITVYLAPEYEPRLVQTVTPGLYETALTSFQGTLFWNEGALSTNHVWEWTRDGGTVRLLDGGTDLKQGMADFSTDGVDMVWAYAHGRSGTSPDERFQYIDLMTAPYTLDPAKVVPRRLRSLPTRVYGVDPTVTGHGFTARMSGRDDDNLQLQIVRLADGAAWTFVSPGGGPGWSWGNVLAMTAEHLYVQTAWVAADHELVRGIARLRLDSRRAHSSRLNSLPRPAFVPVERPPGTFRSTQCMIHQNRRGPTRVSRGPSTESSPKRLRRGRRGAPLSSVVSY